MTTPVEGGFLDDEGNFIPSQFADELDLPAPGGTGTAEARKAKQALQREQARGRSKRSALTAGQARVRALRAQLKTKGLSKQRRAQLSRQISRQQARNKTIQAQRQVSVTRQGALRRSYWEISGQFERLLTGQERDAYASLRSLFNQFGLGSLAPKIYDYAKQGYGADVISLLLQDTKEYKERFAANEARTKKGLPVLSPAEYLATEQAYRQVLQETGLPEGFYDSPTDFRNWIAGDVSPTEIKNRADLAVQNAAQANPAAKQALKDLYGVGESYVAAYFLDKTRSLPLLQKQSQAAQFGGEALKRNLVDINKDFLEYLATSGLSQAQVGQGYAQIAETLPLLERIAGRYGETFTQREAESDIFAPETGLYGATAKRKRLASQERALFAGAGGATPGGLAQQFQQT